MPVKQDIYFRWKDNKYKHHNNVLDNNISFTRSRR